MMRMTLKGAIFVLLLNWCLPAPVFAESGKQQFLDLISGAEETENTQLYTSYNLFAKYGSVRAINFRVGSIIPAGTPVKVKFVEEYEDAVNSLGEVTHRIRFTTLPDKKNYTLKFTQRYHPGKTIFDYANLMFGKKTFEQRTAGKSLEIINATRRSAVIVGMTKEEVIISYGYPSEHVTPSLAENSWTFWRNRFGKKLICFDVEDRAISCEKLKVADL